MLDYINRVQSTLKGGCSVDLGPKTVLVGPNGSGKSTVIQSMELATTGHVSDMEGREVVKQQAALGRLFPSDARPGAAATMASGAEFSWDMERKAKGGFKRPVHLAPGHIEWPLAALKKTLAGDASTVGSWLETHVGVEQEGDEFYRFLPEDVHETVQQLVSRHATCDMLALAKSAKGEVRGLRTQATKTEKTIDALLSGVTPPLSATARAKLNETLEERLKHDPSAVTQEDYDAQKQVVEEMAGEYARALGKLVRIPPSYQESAPLLSNLRVITKMQREHEGTFGAESTCMVCGSDLTLGERRALVEEAIQSLSQGEDFAQTKAQADLLYEKMIAKADDIKSLRVRDESVEEEREGILRVLGADAASQKTWDNAKAMRKEVQILRGQADKVARAAKELEKAGKHAIATAQAKFSEKVESFLPAGVEVGVNLDIARLGFVRDGELHSALSGAEWSQTLLAIASSCSDGSTPTVLVPDDRAWDQDTLGRVMAALVEAPAQVVIMSTVRPPEVPGWKIVDLTERA